MVKLSLVNLYLHGFSKPNVFEYDTLSSEKRWDETYDVILANPPFMTPSGGIRPHKRFSIQANRAEVLFVDYIAEHLNIKGRAGIIVPEGIIFQSSNAYKNLRKNLVENWGLYAVVSMPAGIFNPYAGVKTSVLLLDRELAKKTKEVLFVRVENDGFGLGAQRKEIDKNDLPTALEILNKWKTSFVIPSSNQESIAHAVAKDRIAEGGDYNLTGDRYKKAIDYSNVKWPMITLGEVCDIFNGSTPSKKNIKYWDNGNIPWFTIQDIRGNGRIINVTQQKITKKALNETSVKLLPKNTVLLCCTASVGEYALSKIELTTNQQFNGLVIKGEYENKLISEYLFWISSTFKEELMRLSGKTSFNFISVKSLKTIKIPFPPIETQNQIVAKLEKIEKENKGLSDQIEKNKLKIKSQIDEVWGRGHF